jgi:hypothetical protein
MTVIYWASAATFFVHSLIIILFEVLQHIPDSAEAPTGC